MAGNRSSKHLQDILTQYSNTKCRTLEDNKKRFMERSNLVQEFPRAISTHFLLYKSGQSQVCTY